MVSRIIEKLQKQEDIQEELYELLKQSIIEDLQNTNKIALNAFRILPSFVRFAKPEDKIEVISIAFKNIYKLVKTEKLRFIKQLYRSLYKPKDKKILKDITQEIEEDEIQE
ncbi:MAG: hypothetical protein QXR71_04590 [Candidatus Aenigmatarchaeota archaeon]